jgi:hydroxypyruvate reductase
VIAFGKAAPAMARAAARLGARDGRVHGFPGADPMLPGFEYVPSGHPLPLPGFARDGRRTLEFAASCGPRLLLLVSGGGSSMLEAPRAPWEEGALIARHADLLAAGLPIGRWNAARTAMSAVKGGGLLAAAAPRAVLNAVLSDVPGRPMHCVASGPGFPGRWWRGQPGRAVLVADGRTAREAAALSLRRDGYSVRRIAGVRGEARLAGPRFVATARGGGGDAAVAFGETTARVRGDGLGGRNHEFVLAASLSLLPGESLLALATDGLDGNSGRAGAFLDDDVSIDAGALSDALRRSDSAGSLLARGGSFATGPTGTNVADLVIWLRR